MIIVLENHLLIFFFEWPFKTDFTVASFELVGYKYKVHIRYKLACTYSDDSNQSTHSCSLIRVLVFNLKKH